MGRLVVHALVLFVVAELGLNAVGAESTFYQREQAAEEAEASRMMAHVFDSKFHAEDGYIQDSSLIDTNNLLPVLTNAPVSYAGFTSRGELAGIKLGMTMSEVVAVWGKPKRLSSSWVIGPRFYYGTGKWGELSLWFSGDRLVWIEIGYTQAEHVTFDNGLTGMMGRAETETLLGAPALRHIDQERHIDQDVLRRIDHDAPPFDLLRTNAQYWLYIGNYAYRAGKLRTDIAFKRALTHGSSGPTERLYSIGVCLEREVEPFFESGGANGRQPVRSETNRTPAAAASRRSP